MSKRTNKERDQQLDTHALLLNEHAKMIGALESALGYIFDEVLTDEQRLTLTQRAQANKDEGEEIPRILIP